MKTIKVVAAIIRDSTKHKIYATARGYGAFKGKWEFPGGKIEAGESPQEALRREIQEELAVEIRVEEKLASVEYDYPEFHLSMECFWAEIQQGAPVLLAHEAARWLTKEELYSVEWLPADQLLLPAIADVI